MKEHFHEIPRISRNSLLVDIRLLFTFPLSFAIAETFLLSTDIISAGIIILAVQVGKVFVLDEKKKKNFEQIRKSAGTDESNCVALSMPVVGA